MLPLLAVGAGIKGALSLFQMIKAGQLNKKRPEYEIPIEMYQYLNKAKEQANQTSLPAQDIMEANLRQTTQGALGRATEIAGGSANLLGSLADIYSNETKGVNQLNIAAANRYDKNQQGLMQAEQTMSGYKDKQFKLNQMDPYLAEMSAKSALMGSSILNLGGAASELTNGLIAQKNNDMLMEALGLKKNKDTAIGEGTGGINDYAFNQMGKTDFSKLFSK